MVDSLSCRAIRGAFLDFVDDPFHRDTAGSVRFIPDGLLVVEGGVIQAFGDYATLQPDYPNLEITTYPGQLIVPGLIDLHVHEPQTEMIAADGSQLLEWLHQYTFPTESKFRDPDYARQIACFFLDELLRNGTTTALVLTTIFPQSVEVLFEEAARRNMRLIAGQVLMSRNAPDFLLNDAPTAYAQTREQIQQWHGKGRSLYAITPRFAITSTDEELQLAGKLKAEFSDVYVHTHLSENRKEVEYTAELFPQCSDYLNVYEQFGLVGDRSIFAHCVQLDDSAFERLSSAGAAIAFCPTSNLFLGSGLFRLNQAKSADLPVKVGLATD
ncbi:MAG TPA: guanine deaminase, partial [Chroococcidiopsis sp.]